MKTFCKYFLTFVLGAVLATLAISVFIPATIHAEVGFLTSGGAPSPLETLETFKAINSELPGLVDNHNLTFAVVPANYGNGYNVVGFDTRLRARFHITDWAESLAKINDRMVELLTKTKKPNKAEQATPRKLSD